MKGESRRFTVELTDDQRSFLIRSKVSDSRSLYDDLGVHSRMVDGEHVITIANSSGEVMEYTSPDDFTYSVRDVTPRTDQVGQNREPVAPVVYIAPAKASYLGYLLLPRRDQAAIVGDLVLALFAVDQAALLCSWGQNIVGGSAASNSVGRI